MSAFDRMHVEAALRDRSLVRSVDVVPRGHVRIGTSFLYPDGGAIDLFVVPQDPLFSTYKLTDLGQTTSWLLDVQLRPWLSKKRQRFVEDALQLYGVTQSGGAFERPLASLDELMPGIVLLGQACVRVADLIYTRRSALTTAVTEQVEEMLSDAGLVYEANAELVGRQGARVRVDFVVEGARRRSALLTLASGNSSQAHVQANEIFARWYDLDVPESAEQRVTVFDDRVDVYRDQDLKRLRSVSDVVALSDPGALTDLLAA